MDDAGSMLLVACDLFLKSLIIQLYFLDEDALHMFAVVVELVDPLIVLIHIENIAT